VPVIVSGDNRLKKIMRGSKDISKDIKEGSKEVTSFSEVNPWDMPHFEKMVDYLPDRPLQGGEEHGVAQIGDLLPGTKWVPYTMTPFFNMLLSLQGVSTKDQLEKLVHTRNSLFSKLPLVQYNVNLDHIVFTQPSVNWTKIQTMMKRGFGQYDKIPAFIVRYKGEDYVIDGHHRMIARLKSGFSTIATQVLDLDHPPAGLAPVLKSTPTIPILKGFWGGLGAEAMVTEAMAELHLDVSPTSPKGIEEVVDWQLANAQQVEPRVTSDIKAVASMAGGSTMGLDYRIKQRSSMTRKIKTKIESGEIGPDPRKWVTDALRYTMVFYPADWSKCVQNAIFGLEEKGYELTEGENSWPRGDSYSGLHYNMVVPYNGLITELQFHTADSFMLKEKTLHKMYEEYRKSSTPLARRQELFDLMTKYWDSIELPKDALKWDTEKFYKRPTSSISPHLIDTSPILALPPISAAALQAESSVKALVRGVIRTLVSLVGDLVKLEDGSLVDPADVEFAHWSPTRGLTIDAGLETAGMETSTPPNGSDDQRIGSLHLQAASDATGVMIALVPPEDVLAALHWVVSAQDEYGDDAEPVDQMHVTLVYLGSDPGAIDMDSVHAVASALADITPEFEAKIGGYGVFHNDDKVLYAGIDAPGLERFRSDLMDALASLGVEVPDDHGFTAHLTLAYCGKANTPTPPEELEGAAAKPFSLGTLVVAEGGKWTRYPLHTSLDAVAHLMVREAVEADMETTASEPDTLTTVYNLPYDSSLITNPEVVAAKGYHGWDDLPLVTVDPTKVIGIEKMLKSKSINKVVSGEVPLRSGYDPWMLRMSDGRFVVIDGHHRVAMHTALGKPMPCHLLDNQDDVAPSVTAASSDMTGTIDTTSDASPTLPDGFCLVLPSSTGQYVHVGSGGQAGDAWRALCGATVAHPDGPSVASSMDAMGRATCSGCINALQSLRGDPLQSKAAAMVHCDTCDSDYAIDGMDEVHDHSATLNETPEPALPETDGADPLAWLKDEKAEDNVDIAKAAALFIKEGVRSFTKAEQQVYINEGEGEGVVARNLDTLDLAGTHYDGDEEDWLV